MLELVLENYMGVYVFFVMLQLKQKKLVVEMKQVKFFLNFCNFFLKFRDWYIRMLNDMVMSGDYMGMVGFGYGYSCNVIMDNIREYYRFNEECEIIVLQEELVVF